MLINEKLSKIPLGLPLIVSAVGTVISLRGGKSVHGILGAAWLLLSVWHGLQHRAKLVRDVKSLCPCSGVSLPLNKFMTDVEVCAFTPGRVRLRHKSLVGNDGFLLALADIVRSVAGVTNVTCNQVTGSMLVEYDTSQWQIIPTLNKLEKILARKAKIK